MQFSFDANKDNIFITQDTGRQLSFEIGEYRTSKIKQIQDVLSPANTYLRTLDSRITDQMFESYIQAAQVLHEQNNVIILDKKLQRVVRDIINLVDLEKLRRWIQIDSGIVTPPEIETKFENVDEQYERAKTYLKHEYIDLLTLAVALRFVLPIWGLYIARTKEAVSEYTKELRAYNLLKQSTIASHPAYSRLMMYVEVSFTESVRSASSTVSGIGRIEIPEWLCSLIMVRRLSIIDITSGGVPNIVQKLFGFVNDAMLNLEKKFKETINTKKPQKEAKTEKDPSFLETYRVKQELPYGLIDSYNVYLTNVYKVCADIDPTIDHELVNDVIRHCDGLVRAKLSQHNLLIMQWLLSPVVPASIVDTLEKVSVVNGMIASQAILHHWGMHELALTVTGINLDQRINIVGDHLSKITPEQTEVLKTLYPYNITDRRDLKAKQKQMDEGSLLINEIGTELIAYKRAVRTPSFVSSKDVPTVNQFGHMVTPPTINILLADMVIKINALLRDNRVAYEMLMKTLTQ